MNKMAFIVSIALTTFALVAVGGIVVAVRAADHLQAASTQATVNTTPDSTTALDPAVQQALTEREAAYQKMIAEANSRLEQAQQQQVALQNQLAALQANNTAQPANASQPETITPEKSVEIASKFLGQTSVYSVESVSMQGTSVYKVTFSSGDIVYVGQDGQVLGSVSAKLQLSAAGIGGAGGHGEGEHENGGDD